MRKVLVPQIGHRESTLATAVWTCSRLLHSPDRVDKKHLAGEIKLLKSLLVSTCCIPKIYYNFNTDDENNSTTVPKIPSEKVRHHKPYLAQESKTRLSSTMSNLDTTLQLNLT